MPRLFVRCARMVSLLVVLPAGCSSKETESSGRVDSSSGDAINWVGSWPEAQKQASAADKLIMIDFYTDWCTWCKVLDQKTYPDPAVVKLASGIVSIKLNAEKEPGIELAKKYRVSGYPAIVFVDKTGKSVGSIDGYYPPERFSTMMKSIIAKRGG